MNTWQVLLQHNAKVYLAARSKAKADAAIASLKEATGKEAIFLELDLADLASVKKSAQEFLSKESELHVLFNNAYAWRLHLDSPSYSLKRACAVVLCTPPIDMLTKDGYDLQFGTNVVGHFYFTELLMPALIAGVASSPDHHTRIITTSSSGAYLGKIRFETFKDSPTRRKTPTDALYYQSKLVRILLSPRCFVCTVTSVFPHRAMR